jgi:DNA-binding CsgD family transcriptional regulator
MTDDPVAILEAAYDLASDEEPWLQRLVELSWSSLDGGYGVSGWTYDVSSPDVVRIRKATSFRATVDIIKNAAQFDETLPAVVRQTVVKIYRTGFVGNMAQAPDALRRAGLGGPIADRYEQSLAELCRRGSYADAMWINAQDPTRIGCMLVAPTRTRKRPSAREVNKWQRVAAHLVAAFRVRRQFAGARAATGTGPIPEAILRPDGRLEHADTAAKPEVARDSLRRAVLAYDRARGSLRRRDPEEAMAIWQALVAGRWSLVDHFDSDGRRFVVAHRNDAIPPDGRAFTLRERQVMAYVAIGHSNKQIAYELGLATSTVGWHLARARAKLELPSLAAVSAAGRGGQEGQDDP